MEELEEGRHSDEETSKHGASARREHALRRDIQELEKTLEEERFQLLLEVHRVKERRHERESEIALGEIQLSERCEDFSVRTGGSCSMRVHSSSCPCVFVVPAYECDCSPKARGTVDRRNR